MTVLTKYQSSLDALGISLTTEAGAVTIRAVPLPLRQQNLQNLIPELIGYLAGQSECDTTQVAKWLADRLENETRDWSVSQAIALLADVERLCPGLVKSPPGGLLQPVDLNLAINALKHD